MSFDYFNTSHLAFGSKLTKAFRQLEKLCSSAEDNLGVLFSDLEIYNQFISRNYRVPNPAGREDAPVRSNEIFNVIGTQSFAIKELTFDGTTLTVKLNLFNGRTNRITVSEGETEIKEGFACVEEAISNSSMDKPITFVENLEDAKGIILFKYRIDEANNINIDASDINSVLYSNIAGYDHITKVNLGSGVSSGYTASDYEVILVRGTNENSGNGKPKLEVKVNNTTHTYVTGRDVRKYCIVYLKPKDKLTGSFDRAWKVIYS